MKKIMIALAMTVGFSATAFAQIQMSPQQACAINSLDVTTNLTEQNKRVQLDFNTKNIFSTAEFKSSQVRAKSELKREMVQAEVNARISMVQFSAMVNKVEPGQQIQQLHYSLEKQMMNSEQQARMKTEEIQNNARRQAEGMQQKLSLEIQKIRSEMQLKQQAIKQQLEAGMKVCSAIPTVSTTNGLTQ